MQLQITWGHFKLAQITSVRFISDRFRSLPITPRHFKPIQVTADHFRSLLFASDRFWSLSIVSDHFSISLTLVRRRLPASRCRGRVSTCQSTSAAAVCSNQVVYGPLGGAVTEGLWPLTSCGPMFVVVIRPVCLFPLITFSFPIGLLVVNVLSCSVEMPLELRRSDSVKVFTPTSIKICCSAAGCVRLPLHDLLAVSVARVGLSVWWSDWYCLHFFFYHYEHTGLGLCMCVQ